MLDEDIAEHVDQMQQWRPKQKYLWLDKKNKYLWLDKKNKENYTYLKKISTSYKKYGFQVQHIFQIGLTIITENRVIREYYTHNARTVQANSHVI
jgi:hypothetical protein